MQHHILHHFFKLHPEVLRLLQAMKTGCKMVAFNNHQHYKHKQFLDVGEQDPLVMIWQHMESILSSAGRLLFLMVSMTLHRLHRHAQKT